MKSNRWISFIVLLILVVVMISPGTVGIQNVEAAPQAGAVLYVKPDDSGAEDCSTWDDACELQDALESAKYGDQIWVAMGIYTPTYQTDPPDERSATFEMEPGVALYGGFTGTESELVERDWETNFTVLSGDLDGNDITDPNGVVTDTTNIVGSNAYHVVVSEGVTETAMLNGFIITGGYADGEWVEPCLHSCGGGMYNDTSSPTLSDLIFSGNYAVEVDAYIGGGGGIYNFSSSPLLTNVILSGNTTIGIGAGMYNDNSNPELAQVIFDGNRADFPGGNGGGIYNISSTPVLTDVTFLNNYAVSNGGGMYNVSSNPLLNNVLFRSNTSGGYLGGGGGMSNSDSSPLLIDVIFSDNSALEGGGMYNVFSNPILTNVSFIGNQAGITGGGIRNTNSTPELTNVIFSGNFANNNGAGMWNSGSSALLVNVSISGNHAGSRGGGIYNTGSNPIITNTILWGNTADETSLQIFNENNSIPVISYSDIEGGCEISVGNDCSGGGNIDADPLFVRNPDPGPDGIWGYGEDDYGDLRLGPLSPAIDAGDNSVVPTEVTVDLDGNPRFADIPVAADTGNGTAPIVDMGAYEAVNLTPVAEDDLDYLTDNLLPLVVDAPGVLENDSDPNLDPLSAELGDNPSIGDLTLNPDGSFEYLPETEYTGIVTFTYQATDGLLASLPATVTITIEQGQRTIYLPLITHE